MVSIKSDLKISQLELEEQLQLKHKKAGTPRVKQCLACLHSLRGNRLFLQSPIDSKRTCVTEVASR